MASLIASQPVAAGVGSSTEWQGLPEGILSFCISFLHGFNIAGRPAAVCKSFSIACHGDALCQYVLDRDFGQEDPLELPPQPYRRVILHRAVLSSQMEALSEHGWKEDASAKLRAIVDTLCTMTWVEIGQHAALVGRPALLQWAAERCKLDRVVGELSALMVAAVGNHPRTTEVATRCCALEQHNGDFGTALHQAAYVGAAAAVTELVHARAELTARNQSYLQTPLHVACSRNHEQVVDVLLHANSNPSLSDRDGLTALRIAEMMRSFQVIERLQEHERQSQT